MDFSLRKHITLDYLNSLFAEIENSGNKSISFDWENVAEIDTEAIAFYLCVNNWCNIQTIKVVHSCTENPHYQRIQNILAIDDVRKIIHRDIYIVPAKKESETHQIKGLVKQFFENCVQGLETSGIEVMFSELFMNICQHSFDVNGFIFIPIIEKGIFEMIATDLGVGIVKNIKDFFDEMSFENGAEAIQYATNDWVTTGTTEQNRGRGLNTILSSVKVLAGELSILAGNGQFRLIENQHILSTLSYLHKGTFIHIKFNINKLPQKEEEEYGDF